MSPDFFARFLSLRPKTEADVGAEEKFPVSVEIGALDLVPPELRDEALSVLESSTGEPEYLRRRKVRDLVYAAKSVRGEILEGGLEDVVDAIEVSLLQPREKDSAPDLQSSATQQPAAPTGAPVPRKLGTAPRG